MAQARVLALALVVALALVAGGGPAAAAPWTADVDAAVAWAAPRAGRVSIAVVEPDGDRRHYRARDGVPAASVLKVMFMAAYLRHRSVRDRDLREADRDLLRPMIRRSANTPATRIADLLGPGPVNRLADRAGMRDFAYRRPWGLTTTSARDQARLMFHLRRFVPERHERYAMRLLRRIVPAQRWGIGEVETPGWRRHFKGGWGSGSGAVDHQVVRLTAASGRRVSLAVMTTNSPSHDYATATLRGVFRRLLRDLPPG